MLLEEMAEAINKKWPQKKGSIVRANTVKSWNVTAADLLSIDKSGRPSGWLWNLFVQHQGTISCDTSAFWYAKTQKSFQVSTGTTATEAIINALHALLED